MKINLELTLNTVIWLKEKLEEENDIVKTNIKYAKKTFPDSEVKREECRLAQLEINKRNNIISEINRKTLKCKHEWRIHCIIFKCNVKKCKKCGTTKGKF